MSNSFVMPGLDPASNHKQAMTKQTHRGVALA